jgi:ketosteroid isomerase-like protein
LVEYLFSTRKDILARFSNLPMKIITLILTLALASSVALAQTDLEKLVTTERSFASLAAEKGIKTAFLEYMSDDAVLFLPDKVSGKPYWLGRGESQGLLAWAPNYADVSYNGLIGYTTGNWEYRAKDKGDAPAAYGEFVTVWQRGQDGRYRLNVDIGINHDKPASYSDTLVPPSYPKSANDKNTSAADTANSFFEIAGQMGLSKAYKTYAAKNMRSFREGMMPMIGKGALLSYISKMKTKTTLTKRTVFFGSADIAYVTNTYTQTRKDNTVEKGNFMQIWKLIDGRWQIVLDIFKPVPAK